MLAGLCQCAAIRYSLRFLLLSLWRDLQQRRRSVHHRALRDLHLFHVLARRKVEHDIGEYFLDDRAESASASASLEGLLRDRAQRRLLEAQLHFLELEQLGILLRERVLRLLEDAHERFLVERLERDDHRQTADELGDQPVAEQIVRHDLGEGVLLLLAGLGAVDARETDLPTPRSRFDDLLETVERAAADEENVLRVDLDVFLLRMLPPALRGDGRDGSFENLEQRLLHALARDVPRYARVLRLARDLIDLVDVDDAALALGDIEIACLEKAHENVLDVLADVPSLGERRGVCNRERDVQYPRQCLREERLAHARRADEHDVGLVQLDVVVANRRRIDALVMIVDRDRQRLLRALLADHILVEYVFDLLGRRDLGYGLGDLPLFIFRQDLVAERDALVADVDRWPGNEFPDRVLGLSAERAAQVFVVRHNESLQRTRMPGGGSRLGRRDSVRGARE